MKFQGNESGTHLSVGLFVLLSLQEIEGILHNIFSFV